MSYKSYIILQRLSGVSGSECISLSWDGYQESSDRLALLLYSERNASRLRGKYLAWEYELGQYTSKNGRLQEAFSNSDGFNYWWMSQFAEKSPYKLPLKDIIRLLALEEIIAEHSPAQIQVQTNKKWLKETLTKFCERQNIALEIEPVTSEAREVAKEGAQKGIQGRVPLIAKTIGLFLKTLVTCCGRSRYPSKWWDGDRQAIFFCSFFDNLDINQAKEGHYFSHYWGRVVPFLNESDIKSNWLQIFISCKAVPDRGTARGYVSEFNASRKSYERHILDSDLYSPGVLFKAFVEYLKTIRKTFRFRKEEKAFRSFAKNSLSFWPLMEEKWKESLYGPEVFINALWLEIFKKALANLPSQKKGFYLCENQPWEKALVWVWGLGDHGELIGVPHTSIRFWDLRYFSHSECLERECYQPSPDYYAVNGKASINELVNAGMDNGKIIECEALRYEYLMNDQKVSPVKEGIKLLVLGDVMSQSTSRLMSLLVGASSSIDKSITVDVKPHPNCPIEREQYPMLSFNVISTPLSEVISEYNVALVSNSTSAALDAYLAGVKVIVMLDEDDLNFSPLRGLNGISYATSSDELIDILAKLSEDSLSHAKGHGNDFFTFDPELTRWSRLLES